MSKHFFQPVKPWILNQHFGQNKACVSTDGKNHFITCDGHNPPKGYKSIYGAKGHLGIDLHATYGQPVYASCGGVVDEIDTEPRSGLDVRIVSDINGTFYKHIYEHLQGHNVKKGQIVEVGDLIGWADNTGWSSGNHLHFELKELKNGKWVSIDPLPLMENVFALQFASMWKQVKELLALVAELLAEKLRKPVK